MLPNASFLREDKARMERWAHLTEGLQSEYDKRVLETLLDNQSALQEETTTANVAEFNRIAYPLIRRVFPGLVANRLVSIQPAELPTTMVFYLDFKYGTSLAPTVAGDRADYQAGKRNKWYASGVVKGEAVGTGDGSTTTFNLDWYPVKPGSVVIYVDSVVTSADVDHETGAITFTTAPEAGASITADYALVMEGLGSKGNAVIPEVELDMSSASVTVETKKLKAKWTIEMEQDFAAYHRRSAESELVKFMSDEIRREIDRLIIDDLYENASAGNINWDSTIPQGTSRKDHYETLMHAIGDASLQIYKKRLVHANFVVLSPDALNYLDKVNTFRVDPRFADDPVNTALISGGPNVMGTLSNRYTVVVDPLFPANKILVGHKGASWLETGYVFAPYRAFQTQTFVDPNDMIPRKGLMSRFGRHLISGDFYATVTIQ